MCVCTLSLVTGVGAFASVALHNEFLAIFSAGAVVGIQVISRLFGHNEFSRVTIRALPEQVCNLCDFRGEIRWDASKPDGQPSRCLDTSRVLAEFGFRARTSLRDGLIETIAWYEKQRALKIQEALELLEW